MDSNTDPADLLLRFRELSDGELWSLCGAGKLNEVAQAVALGELAARGIAPPGAAQQPAPYQGEFTTVARFLNPTDAHIVRGALEAAGLPAIVADANLVQMNQLWAAALGGVRVLVPASRVAEAREVIAAYQRGDLALRGDSDASRQ